MPEFILNKNDGNYDSLSDFAKAYVEAMLFTNCDCGDDDEFKADRLGTSRLTRKSIAAIARDCDKFQQENAATIARVLDHGERDLEGIAHDFWFTRQRHGAGFWEGESRGYPGDTGDTLDAAAKAFGEVYSEIYRGWIYVR